MLGALFFVVAHGMFQACVFGLVASAGMRARDRAIFQFAPGNPHQHLRRRAQDLCLPHSQEIKIWRRIYLAECTIKIERLDAGDEVEPLRKHDLKNITCRDVFFAALHAAQEFRTRGSGMDFEFPRLCLGSFAPHRRTQSRSQFSFECGNVAHGAVVRLTRFFPRNVGRGHDVNLMTQVVEGQEPVEEHQFAIRQRKIVLGMFANRLQLANHVV